MSSKISANRRLEELIGDNEFDITAHANVRGENCVAWFFANKQLKMEIQIEALEDEVQDLEDERDDKDEEIEKLKEQIKESNTHDTTCMCDVCEKNDKLKEENLELRLAVRRNQDEIDRLREILG